jgi:hypothetical protein
LIHNWRGLPNTVIDPYIWKRRLTAQKENAMQVYMVERSLKGIPMDALAAAQKRAIETSQKMSKEGTQVRYIRSTFVPDDGTCMCLFAAERSEDVKRVNELANIPFERIVPALDLTPA